MSLVLRKLELIGFKSFAKKTVFEFPQSVTAIVGPNGSGKSNVVESIRFVLGEQSAKSLRSKTGADLIFKGSQKTAHMNRAMVTITFDNTKRLFQLPSFTEHNGPNLDFDEISISREVSTDGSQNYRINGTEVRMKDIHELIASVNIGTSGHHIISQGEADRLLGAKAVERREMLEESLGLRLYHYRIRETEKKLEKSRTYLAEAGSLRRELAPHIKFLKKQVEKIELAKVYETELGTLYRDYFIHTGNRIAYYNQVVMQKIKMHNDAVVLIDNQMSVSTDTQFETDSTEIKHKQQQLRTSATGLRSVLDTHERGLGRVEGMLEILSAPVISKQSTTEKTYPAKQITGWLEDLQSHITTLTSADIISFKQSILDYLGKLKQTLIEQPAEMYTGISSDNDTKQTELVAQKSEHEQKIAEIKQQLQVIQTELDQLDTELVVLQTQYREREQQNTASKEQKHYHQRELDKLQFQTEQLQHDRTAMESEYVDAIALFGDSVLDYKSVILPESELLPSEQITKLHTDIQRLKIKLEEYNLGSSTREVMDEYTETVARDNHIAAEITDVEQTISELESALATLREQLTKDFTSGVKLINTEFQNFFSLMFGGGNAKLSLVTVTKKRKKSEGEGEIEIAEDESESELGIEIDVDLPRKKVKDLDMLSGGERSLTSIALLFALSQVNPPPFLVLDETDAALDEVNSRKYGDMIENLSEKTQLVVVTHNRETMSRAGILYGVTLGGDDSSTTLSINFETAEKIAK